MRVYSSVTGRWEERSFALEEQIEGSIDGVVSVSGHAAYWHGALRALQQRFYYKSKDGIHFATIIEDQCRLHVWFLDESGGKTTWVHKHGINVQAVIEHFWNNLDDQADRPWILEADDMDQAYNKGTNTPIVEKILDWDSDDENAVDIKDGDEKDFESGRALVPHHSVLVFEAFSATAPGQLNAATAYLLDELTDNCRADYHNVMAAAMRGDYDTCGLYAGHNKYPLRTWRKATILI
nr:unnamed protein product [Digitaria exilis]